LEERRGERYDSELQDGRSGEFRLPGERARRRNKKEKERERLRREETVVRGPRRSGRER